MFGGEGEDGERERGEGLGFFAGGNDGGGHPRGMVAVVRLRLRARQRAASMLALTTMVAWMPRARTACEELLGEFFWRAEEFFGSGDVEDGAEMRVGHL